MIKNKKGLGPLQKSALEFAARYPGWHSFQNDSYTWRTIKSLEKRSLIEVDYRYEQFRLA